MPKFFQFKCKFYGKENKEKAIKNFVYSLKFLDNDL